MSIYASFDEHPGEQFASNRGWGDFVRWAEGLDAETFPRVVQLVEHGHAADVASLADELEKAAAAATPDAEGLDATIAALIHLFRANTSAEAVFINDGMFDPASPTITESVKPRKRRRVRGDRL